MKNFLLFVTLFFISSSVSVRVNWPGPDDSQVVLASPPVKLHGSCNAVNTTYLIREKTHKVPVPPITLSSTHITTSIQTRKAGGGGQKFDAGKAAEAIVATTAAINDFAKAPNVKTGGLLVSNIGGWIAKIPGGKAKAVGALFKLVGGFMNIFGKGAPDPAVVRHKEMKKLMANLDKHLEEVE